MASQITLSATNGFKDRNATIEIVASNMYLDFGGELGVLSMV